MPADPQPSPEDVELVATATEQHHIDYETTDAMGNNPCVCGKWWDAAGDNPGWDQHMAEVALAALASAGRLVPDGAKKEWGAYVDNCLEHPLPEQGARNRAKTFNGWLWFRWVGPWQPVEDTP